MITPMQPRQGEQALGKPGAPQNWAVASHTLNGGFQCGDMHVVQPFAGGVLYGVIDGLGHGHDAHAAAMVAAETLRKNAHKSLVELIELCHEQLRSTRGAVMSLATLTANACTWIGVGNVDGVLVRLTQQPQRTTLLQRGGVVGYRLPTLRVSSLPILPGDTLVFATDGIDNAYGQAVNPALLPEQMAARILQQFGKASDDALVLVVRHVVQEQEPQ